MGAFNPFSDSGERIGARHAPIKSNGPLTVEQLAQVRHAYTLFKLATKNAAGTYIVQHRSYPDGMRVRMVSENGRDTVYVQATPVEEELSVLELFWGVPQNSTDPAPLSPRSGYWAVGRKLVMPDALKQRRDLVDHPGHVTWSGAAKTKRKAVSLSWRGPRDRYSFSTGWSTSSGGAIVAHDESTTILAPVFTDGAYIWINGRKVATPCTKIIAASLVELGAGDWALRLCTDNISGDGTTRKVGTLDLRPAGSTLAVTLAQLVSASAFDIRSTYTATDNGAAAGQWLLGQRPHFDREGDRLATVIQVVTGGVWKFVSFDPTTWAMLETADCTSTLTRTVSSVTNDNTPTVPRIITIDETVTSDTLSIYPLGADYLDANFVYLWAEDDAVRTDEAHETYNAGNRADTYTIGETSTLTIKHSHHGTITSFGDAWSYGTTFTYPGGGGAGDGSMTAYSVKPRTVSFIGDLQRDTFAVGWCSTRVITRDAYTGAATVGLGAYGIDVLTTALGWSFPHSYTVWMGGAVRASGTNGSFANPAPTSGAPSSGVRVQVTAQKIDQYLASGYTPPAAGTFVSNITPGDGTVRVVYRWLHAAVNWKRDVAYLGLRILLAPSPSTDSGIEIALFRDPKTLTYSIATVPPYAGGTKPTISAPVFPGDYLERRT